MFGTVYIVPDLGLAWWYGIIAIANGVLLVLAVFFAAETRFDRSVNGLRKCLFPLAILFHPLSQCLAEAEIQKDPENGSRNRVELSPPGRVTSKQERILRPDMFGPRTLRHDMRLVHGKPKWKACIDFYKVTMQGLVVPTIVWLILLNGALLGVYVYQASTFAPVLMVSYGFGNAGLGYLQLAQILACVAMVPILGYGSDVIVKTMSRWNGGVYRPEYRVISLIVPWAAILVSTVVYGQAAQFPERGWHWMGVAGPYVLGYFAFLGGNAVGITYAVDSFPQQAGPLLLLICAGRGMISFALSFSIVPLVGLTGYDGAMNIFAIICGILVGLGIPVYFLGGIVTRWVLTRMWREGEAELEVDHHGIPVLRQGR